MVTSQIEGLFIRLCRLYTNNNILMMPCMWCRTSLWYMILWNWNWN